MWYAMTEHDPDRWQRVKGLLRQALELDTEQRAAFLAEACSDDASFRDEVESLLQHEDDAEKEGFLHELVEGETRITKVFNRSLASAAPSPEHGLHIRCPHCHNPVEVVADTPFTDITCGSCGGFFSLVGGDTTTQSDSTVTAIGHFELVERLGGGGFGTVWKARDKELDRTVAIKIPRKGQLSAAETEQFLREARATAQLRHPNIVSVHEVGRHEDSVYIVSDFVRGVTLADWLTANQLTRREATKLCLMIATALDHAHRAGVVHRDLKPQNIMIDGRGEPHLMDFGLARREAGEITMTVEGQILGTPAYMSPEQAKGEGHQADRRSDVYSLGVILFELLTGELPFRGNVSMLIHQVLYEDAPSPRKLNSSVSRDMDTLCLKCLEKEPKKRYQTAGDFRDELRRILDGESIRARPVGRFNKAWRWCRRNTAVASLLATSMFLMAGLTIGALVAAARFKEQNEQATTSLQRALDAETQRQFRLYDAYVAEARATRSRHEPGRRFDAIEAVTRAARLVPQLGADPATQEQSIAQLRNEAIAAMALEDLRLDCRHRSEVQGFSPHHKWDFDSEVTRISCMAVGGNVVVLRVSDRRAEHTLPGRWSEEPVTCFSPTGEHLAVRGMWSDRDSHHQRLQLWRLSPQELILDEPVAVEDFSRELAFTADGRLFAFLKDQSTVSICAADTGKELQQVDLTAPTFSFEFCPKTDRLLVAVENDIQLIDWRNENVDATFSHDASVSHAILNPAGDLIAAAVDDHNAYIWALEDPKAPKMVLSGHHAEVRRLAFHASSRLLASWSWDGTTRLWDVGSGRELMRYLGRATRFSQDGRWLGFASAETEYGRWEVAAANECRVLSGSLVKTGLTHVDFSPDGRFLATVSIKEGAIIWDVNTGRECTRIEPSRASNLCFFHPMEEYLITSHPKGLEFWRFQVGGRPGETAEFHLVHAESISSFGDPPWPAISDDGRRFIYKKAFDGTNVTIVSAPWSDRVSGKEFTHDDSVWYQTLSPNGQWAATGTRDNPYVYVWDVLTGEIIKKIGTKSLQIAVTDFSPDGGWLVVSYRDECVFYKTDTWRVGRRIPNDASGFGSVAFSADKQLLAVAQKYYVSLRDAESFRELARLASKDTQPLTQPFVSQGWGLAFSSDGRFLAVGTAENSVQLWDLRLVRQQLAEMGLDW